MTVAEVVEHGPKETPEPCFSVRKRSESISCLDVRCSELFGEAWSVCSKLGVGSSSPRVAVANLAVTSPPKDRLRKSWLRSTMREEICSEIRSALGTVAADR